MVTVGKDVSQVERRLAVGLLVCPRCGGRLDPDTGFLGDLADDGDRRGLPDLDPAARQFPVAVIDAAHEQDPVLVIAHDRIDDHDEPTHRWRVRVVEELVDPGHRRILTVTESLIQPYLDELFAAALSGARNGRWATVGSGSSRGLRGWRAAAQRLRCPRPRR